MKLLREIQNAWKVIRSGSLAQSFLRGDDGPATGAELSAPFLQSVWVYSAVNALATNVSQIPFRISRGEDNDENIIASGPAFELFRRPHPNLDRFQFWELLVTWLQLRGEVFVVGLNKSGQVVPIAQAKGRNQIAQMLILSPLRFWHIVQGGELMGWRYTGFGYTDPPIESQVFLPEEILQLRLPNPFDFWRGLSPLSVAMLAAQTDYASAQFMKGLMVNNADTGVIVTTDQQPSAEQRELILAALRERKRKAGTADRPLFLWGGSKIEKPTVSSADMQFLENRKMNRLEIGAVFRVPATIMGFTEDANRAIAEEERLGFIENTIQPLCMRLEAFIEPVVKAFGPDLFGSFHVQGLPVMQNARRSRGDAASKLFALGVPLNDINKAFDLGLPSYPWGNKGYLPFNLQEAGESQDKKEPAQDPKEDAFSRIANGVEKLFAAKAAAPTHTCASDPDYVASIAGAIKALEGKLSKFFFEQRGRVLARLDELKSKSVTIRGIDDIFDLPGETQKLTEKLKPQLLADFEFGGAQIFDQLDLGSFLVSPDDAIAFLDKRLNAIQGMNQVTFDSLKSSLQEGLANGDTHAQLVDRVKAVYQTATESRANTIAVTETNIAVNSGRNEAMVQAKVEKKGWATTSLPNVRPSHVQAGLVYAAGIPMDQPFKVGGYDLMHPGDPSGPPEEVINCRCFLFALVGDKASPKPMLKYEVFISNKK